MVASTVPNIDAYLIINHRAALLVFAFEINDLMLYHKIYRLNNCVKFDSKMDLSGFSVIYFKLHLKMYLIQPKCCL